MTTLFFRIASVFLMLTFSHYSLSDTSIQPISDTVVSNQQIAPPSNPLITHDLSPIGMYHAADWVVKSVMIALLVASILSWAVFITKQIQLVLATKRTKQLLATLVTADTLQHAESALTLQTGQEVSVVTAAQHEIYMSGQGPATHNGIKERVQLRLERVQAELTRDMTSLTGILATIGSVSPFVGLFGTVWGIMNAFIGIAKAKSTTLVVVAPGIAEALLATAIGLVAAIPAVMMYNYFSRRIGHYKALLTDVSVATMVLVSRDCDRDTNEEMPSQLKQVV